MESTDERSILICRLQTIVDKYPDICDIQLRVIPRVAELEAAVSAIDGAPYSIVGMTARERKNKR